jgi:aspartyl-tRNA(Asn)/glutamyl-tRNA(Gln) amidotransferase subunit C
MSKISKEELETLEKLSRVRLTAEEREKLLENLGRVLAYVKLLDEVNTEGVKPCSHVISTMRAPLREDEPMRLIPREEFLKNAPAHVGGMIKVPQVIKDQL